MQKCLLVTIFLISAFCSPLFLPSHEVSIVRAADPPKIAVLPQQSLWEGIKHRGIIRELISCESQGRNIARPDSNGLLSYGILQFNGTSTWNEFSRRAGVSGSPMEPRKAILVADFMISNGQLGRWTCAHLLELL